MMVPPHRNVPEPTKPPPEGIRKPLRKPAPPPTVIVREHGYVGLVVGVAIGLAVIAAFVLGRLW